AVREVRRARDERSGGAVRVVARADEPGAPVVRREQPGLDVRRLTPLAPVVRIVVAADPDPYLRRLTRLERVTRPGHQDLIEGSHGEDNAGFLGRVAGDLDLVRRLRVARVGGRDLPGDPRSRGADS